MGWATLPNPTLSSRRSPPCPTTHVGTQAPPAGGPGSSSTARRPRPCEHVIAGFDGHVQGPRVAAPFLVSIAANDCKTSSPGACRPLVHIGLPDRIVTFHEGKAALAEVEADEGDDGVY